MSHNFQAFAPTIVAFLVQSVLVSLVALSAAHFLKSRGQMVSKAICRAGVTSILILVLLGPGLRFFIHPVWSLSSSAPQAQALHSALLASEAQSASADFSSTSPQESIKQKSARMDSAESAHNPLFNPAREATPSKRIGIFEIVGAIWLLGSCSCLLAIALGSVWIYRLRRTSRPLKSLPLSSALERLSTERGVETVSVTISSQVSSPFVAGLKTPSIFLPENLEHKFAADQIEAIICHEMIHVGQKDAMWAFVSRIACALSWANPLVWILSRKLTMVSEEVCDQLVLEKGIAPATYAGSLLKVAETIMATPAIRLVGAGVFPAKSQLSKRITLMLDRPTKPMKTITTKLRIEIAVVAAVAAIGGCFLVSTEANAAAAISRRDATPTETISSLFQDLNKRDWKSVFSHFEGAKIEEAAAGLAKVANDSKNHMPTFILKSNNLTFSAGDNATAKIKFIFQETGGMTNPPDQDDEIHLHRSNGDWKITDGKSKGSFIDQLALMAKDPKMLGQARDAAKRTVVLSNLKQLSLGVIMYSSDFKDTLSLTQSTIKAKLKPYTRNDRLWFDSDGKPLDVQFNPALSGKKMTSFPNPATTVMLTLGTKGHLVFYGKSTPVAFLDGHVKFVSPADAAKLQWK